MGLNSELRLAIGNEQGGRSTIWKFWTGKNEAYALHRTHGGVEKLSFHSSRICRRAFTEVHPLPPHMSDRVIQRWTRAKTAPAGEGQAVKVLTIIFPTGALSNSNQNSTKKLRSLSAPGPGKARHVQLVVTKEPQQELLSAIKETGRQLEWFYSMPNGENVAIISFVMPWNDETMIVPGLGTDAMDLVFPGMATPGIDRPIFFTSYSQPDELVCVEMSGFKMARDAARLIYPEAGTFTRTEVIDRRGQIFSQ